jgi:molecular chaperone GrpE
VAKKKSTHTEEMETPEGAEAPTAETAEEEAAQSPETELAKCREETKKNWDLYLRAMADLENYRKRAQREREETIRFANENILRELLPVLDNLERAVEHAGKEGSGTNGLLQGVEMTLGQFSKILEKSGIVPVAATGLPLDTTRHEAVGQVETKEFAPNTVVQILQKGYLLNDRLLRPAMVLVAKTPPKQEEEVELKRSQVPKEDKDHG